MTQQETVQYLTIAASILAFVSNLIDFYAKTKGSRSKFWLALFGVFATVFFVMAIPNFVLFRRGQFTWYSWLYLVFFVLLIFLVVQVFQFRLKKDEAPLYLTRKKSKTKKLLTHDVFFFFLVATLNFLLVHEFTVRIPSASIGHRILPIAFSTLIIGSLWFFLYRGKRYAQRFKIAFAAYNVEAIEILSAAWKPEEKAQRLTRALNRCLVEWLGNGGRRGNLITCWLLQPNYAKQCFEFKASWTSNEDLKGELKLTRLQSSEHKIPFYRLSEPANQNGERQLNYGSITAKYFFNPGSAEFMRDRPLRGQSVLLTHTRGEHDWKEIIASHLREPSAKEYETTTAWAAHVFVNLLGEDLKVRFDEHFETKVPAALVLVTSSMYGFGFRDRSSGYLLATHAQIMGKILEQEIRDEEKRYRLNLFFKRHQLENLAQPQKTTVGSNNAVVIEPLQNRVRVLHELTDSLSVCGQWICEPRENYPICGFETTARNQESTASADPTISRAEAENIIVEFDEIVIIASICEFMRLEKYLPAAAPKKVHLNLSTTSMIDPVFTRDLRACTLIKELTNLGTQLAFEIKIKRETFESFQTIYSKAMELGKDFGVEIILDLGDLIQSEMQRILAECHPACIKIEQKQLQKQRIRDMVKRSKASYYVKNVADSKLLSAARGNGDTLKGVQGRFYYKETTKFKELAKQAKA